MKNFQDFDHVTFEQTNELKYLEAFIKETLRMYPTQIIIVRECQKTTTLSDGLVVEKGVQIVVPTYVVHHDEKNYKDPFKFNPNR